MRSATRTGAVRWGWAGAVFLLLGLVGAQAVSQTLVESFNDPLINWRSGWLKTNSNLENYYVAVGSNPGSRGNNPTGLWIHDGDSAVGATITFNTNFAGNVTAFSIRASCFGSFTFFAVDTNGTEFFSQACTQSNGTPVQVYPHTFSFSTPNGLLRWGFRGGSVEGNTAIDDVTVVQETPPPTVDAGGPYDATEGQSVTLTATGSGSGITYAWDLDDDGQFDDGSGPSVSLMAVDGPAALPVAVQVVDGQGRTATDTAVVNVTNVAPSVGPLVLDPVDPDESEQAGLTVQVSDLAGANDPISYLWDFGDGNTSLQANPSHQWADEGTYTVTLMVSDGDGGTAMRSLEVTVGDVPPALSGIIGGTNLNEGTTSAWRSTLTKALADLVDFVIIWGDGSDDVIGAVGVGVVSEEIRREHAYGDEGTYTVTFRAMDDEGNTVVRTRTVNVSNVAPTITSAMAIPENAEIGATITFQGVASDPGDDVLTYTWDFGDNSVPANGPNVAHRYATSGSFTVTLTVTDGDGGSASEMLTVTIDDAVPVITALEGDRSGGEGSLLRFRGAAMDAGGDALTYIWGFGDGSPEVSGVDLTDVTHTWADDGAYTVTLTVSDGNLSAQRTLSVVVNNLNPVLGGVTLPTEGDEGQQLTFSAAATDVPADVLTYTWDFGDGTPQVLGREVSHSFGDDGSFFVQLTVTDGDGGQARSVGRVEVGNVAPTVTSLQGDFAGEEGATFSYMGVAADVQGDTLTWTWSFGDGSPVRQGVNLNSVDHTYASSGEYTLTLTVADEDGGQAVLTRTVTVGGQAPSLQALDGDTEGVEGSPLGFMGLATDPGNDPLTWTWDFGDGSPMATGVALDRVEHIYEDNGTYTLRVVVTDGDGASEATLLVMVTNAAPRILEVVAPGRSREGEPVAVATIVSDAGGDADPLMIRWDFGDGSDPVEGATATHTFRDEGTYTITLTVVDDDGGSASITREVVVSNVAPQVVQFIAPNNADEAREVLFQALASDAGQDDTLIYTWSFGDGSPTVTGEGVTSVRHTWADDGTYTVTLTVNDGAERVTRSLELEVRNLPPTISAFTGDAEGAENTMFSFVAAASDPAGEADALTWRWDFGDGSNPVVGGDLSQISHLYEAEGLYTLRLTVSDGDGGVATRTQVVRVGNVNPTIDTFEAPSEGLEGQSLTFAATASDAGLDELSWRWDFGDNSPAQTGAQLTEVTHTFADNGTYTVTLTVGDGTGAAVRTQEVVVSNVAPRVDEFVVPAEIGEAQVMEVRARASDAAGVLDPLTYTWDFGDGSDPVRGQVARHSYADNGTFTVILTVRDDDGGVTERQMEVAVNNVAPEIVALEGPTRTLEGAEVTFVVAATDRGDDTLSYSWELEGGPTVEGVTEVTYTWPDNGRFRVTVTVTDEDGGRTQRSRVVEVGNVAPSIVEFTGTFSGAEGETLSFQALAADPGDDTLTYSWNFGDGVDVTQGEDLTEVSHSWSQAGTYTLTLNVLDDEGGSVLVTRTVNIDTAAPTISAVNGPNQGLEGQALVFSAVATDPTDQVLRWTWDFGDGGEVVTGEGLDEVEHTWADDGTYVVTVTATDPDGESSTATVVVVVANVAPTIDDLTLGAFLENQEGSVQGAASDPGDDTLTWTWSWGDRTEAAIGEGLSEASHTYAANGTYTLTLTVADEDGGEASRAVEVVVGDEPPVIAALVAPEGGLEGQSLTVRAQASDPANDTLEFTWSVNGAEGVSTGSQPSFSYTYPEDGTYEVTVVVSDGSGSSATRSVQVVVANVAPTIVSFNGRLQGDEGQPMSFFALAIDPAQALDPLTYAWDFGDGAGAVSGDAAQAEHVFADNGTYTVTLTVTDDEGGSAQETLEVTVNNVAPVIVSQAPTVAVAGQEYGYAPQLLEPGADTLIYTLREGPEGMSFTESGVLLWTLPLSQVEGGPFRVSIEICDDDGGCDGQIWEIRTDFIDEDEDGVPDDCEERYGLDPADPSDGDADNDQDGLTNREECLAGTDPVVFNGPTAPAISLPEVGGRVAALMPELAVVNATDPDGDALVYTFEVYTEGSLSQESLLVSMEQVVEGEGSTAWTLGVELTENTRYWWRARAHDAYVAGPWSEVGDFLVDQENEAPSVPVLVSPVGSGDSLQPALVVDASSDPEGDAITYLFEVYSDVALTALVTSGEGAELRWAVDVELTEDTTYWWRAAARDEVGAVSEWAQPWSFLVNMSNRLPEAPKVVRPEEGGLVDTVPVAIEWEQANDEDGDALTYELEVSDNQDFTNPVYAESQIPMGEDASVTIEVPDLAEDGGYWLRVRAFDRFGAGPYTVVGFLVNAEPTAPAAPVLVSPINDARVDVGLADEASPVELVFMPAEDLEGDALTYEVIVYGDAGLSQEVWKASDVSGEGEEVSTSWPEPVAGGYFWTVRAVDSTGLEGPVSETGTFTVVTAVNEAPSAPVAVSPVGGVGIQLAALELVVDNATDPEGDTLSYTFTIYLDEALSQPVWSLDGVIEGEGQTRVVVPDLDVAGGELFWTARANDGRQDGPSSQRASFTILVDITGSTQGSSCGCATPAAPAGGLLWPLGLLSVVGAALLWRRRR